MSGSSRIFSVSEINRYIHRMFEQDYMLSSVIIEGEVSNCKFDQRGHMYFSLKDEGAAISCVMYKGSQLSGLKCRITNGMKCVVSGEISVYERNGTYQVYAKVIKEKGIGNLYEQYEALKKKLSSEGLFDPAHKKKIKPFGRRIGVVTASTGAVIHDIINVKNRRNPYVQLILFPAKVQGDGAAQEIAAGIYFLDTLELDCIIVGRGGGSIEDLWAFNEEVVVRAVFECNTPVISAVGHETDTTLCDFASDLRAPTPSAACELAVFDVYNALEQLGEYQNRIEHVMDTCLANRRIMLDSLNNKLLSYHPVHRLAKQRQILENMNIRLRASLDKRLLAEKHRIQQSRLRLRGFNDRMLPAMEKTLKNKRYVFGLLAQRLELTSPVKRLTGGFVYASDRNGQPLSSIDQVSKKDTIIVRTADGKIMTQVFEKEYLSKEILN